MNSTIKLILNAVIKTVGLTQIFWAMNLAVMTIGPGQNLMNMVPVLEYVAVGLAYCMFSSYIVQFIYSKDATL